MPSTRRGIRGRGVRTAVVLTAAALAATACGGSSGSSGSTSPVSFKGCDKVACSGVIDGAKYLIKLPPKGKWNGTLLLWSHGYREAQPAPPDFAPVDTDAEASPGNVAAISDALLAKGYALAGSAYAKNGFAVPEGVQAGEDVHAFFVKHVGTPRRTYLWGASLGGLITEMLAERNPTWVNGVAPMCGVLGGAVNNFDLALDAAYATKQLVDPTLQLTGYSSYQESVQQFEHAAAAVLAATRDLNDGVPALLTIAALVGAPDKTKTYDGSTVVSQVSGIVESLLTALGFGTFARYELEQRVGGNPSTNVGVDYSTRLSLVDRAKIDAVSPGYAGRALAKLAAGTRVPADQAARTKAATTLGFPTGNIHKPTLTMHTQYDPLVIVENESLFAQRVYANPDRKADLLQLYTSPPATYSQTTQAPYGAGHCNFTAGEWVGTVDTLDFWVRNNLPDATEITSAFGDDTGLNLAFRPGPWPGTIIPVQP